MIFQHTWEKVLSGEKTQTRRIVKPGDFENPWGLNGPDDETLNEVCRGRRGIYTVGKTYAVQPGRGKKAVGRIRITGIRREDVREISDEDARAEGFASCDDFMNVWISMHDKPYYEEWYNNAGGFEADDYDAYVELRKRPAERYDAWVLEFELVGA